MRPFLALAVLLPGLAVAQTAPTVDLNVGGLSTLTLTPSDCLNRITVNWTVGNVSPTSACSPGLQIWATSATTCNSTTGPASGDLTIGTVSPTDFATQTSGSFNISVTDLPIFTTSSAAADGGTATGACGDKFEKTATLCARLPYLTSIYNGCSAGTSSATSATTPKVVYDAFPPSAPKIVLVEQLDTALRVTVTNDADTATVHVLYRQAGYGRFLPGVDITPATTDVGTIQGLQNGIAYELQAYATDNADNASPASLVVTGTPVHTEGFYDRYKRLGGEESGGCSATGGGVLALGLMVATRLISRRRR